VQLEQGAWELRCPSCGEPLTPCPTPESKPLRPTSIYAIGKRDHEEMFLASGQAYGIPTTALRFFNVYGPRQALSNPYTGVAAIFASRLLNGRPPVIFEDGDQSRDFVHVRDIAAGVELALDPSRADGLALNLGTGKRITVNDVGAALAESLGVDIEPEVLGQFRAGDIRHCYSTIALAERELGFTPTVAFAAGMGELAEWLVGQSADDRVDEATAALRMHGLTR
jgi:dTDP-L-rhamnose 4-epimerase